VDRELSKSRGARPACPSCGERLLVRPPLRSETIFVVWLLLTWIAVGLMMSPLVLAFTAAFTAGWLWLRGPRLGWIGWTECPRCGRFRSGNRGCALLAGRRRTGGWIAARFWWGLGIPILFHLVVAILADDRDQRERAIMVLAALAIGGFPFWLASWSFRPDPGSEP